jgi:hypothetical protein
MRARRCAFVFMAQSLNQATHHWHTGSTRKRAISVFRGHRVSESCVERLSCP